MGIFTKLAVATAALLGLRATAAAQASDGQAVAAWNEQRLERQSNAMRVLTAWGGVSTVGGLALGLTANDEQTQQFGYMTAGWGAINAGLGLLGMASARKEDASSMSLEEGATKLRRTEKILLFNAGLDVGYIVGGAYLVERAKRAGEDNPERLRGFGQAVMLQGAGLFLFDLLAYRYLHQGALSLSPTLQAEGPSLGLNVSF